MKLRMTIEIEVDDESDAKRVDCALQEAILAAGMELTDHGLKPTRAFYRIVACYRVGDTTPSPPTNTHIGEPPCKAAP